MYSTENKCNVSEKKLSYNPKLLIKLEYNFIYRCFV